MHTFAFKLRCQQVKNLSHNDEAYKVLEQIERVSYFGQHSKRKEHSFIYFFFSLHNILNKSMSFDFY